MSTEQINVYEFRERINTYNFAYLDFKIQLKHEKQHSKLTNVQLESYVSVLLGGTNFADFLSGIVPLPTLHDTENYFSMVLEEERIEEESRYIQNKIKGNITTILEFLVSDRGYKINVGPHLFDKKQ